MSSPFRNHFHDTLTFYTLIAISHFQMEKLHYSWHLHVNYDLRILSYHLWWTIGIDDNGKIVMILLFAKQFEMKFRFFLFFVFRFFFADIVGASEMFRRDYIDWLSSVSHSWFTMVP